MPTQLYIMEKVRYSTNLGWVHGKCPVVELFNLALHDMQISVRGYLTDCRAIQQLGRIIMVRVSRMMVKVIKQAAMQAQRPKQDIVDLCELAKTYPTDANHTHNSRASRKRAQLRKRMWGEVDRDKARLGRLSAQQQRSGHIRRNVYMSGFLRLQGTGC